MASASNPDNRLAVRERSATNKVLDSLFIPVQLCIVGLLLVGIYIGVIRGAWIPHRLDTLVWIEGDWQVGEYRSCQFLLPTSRLFCGSWDSTRHGGSLSEFISGVSNDDFVVAFHAAMTPSTETDWASLGKYFHVFPVLFHGRIEKSYRDRVVVSWLCQRKDDVLACNTSG
jgi:hypothetical protein